MTKEKFVEIPIKMNRASIGDSKYPFVVLKSSEEGSGIVAWVPKDRITIDQQGVGRTFTGILYVDIVEENEERLLVKTDSQQGEIRLWVDRKTGHVIEEVGTRGYPY